MNSALLLVMAIPLMLHNLILTQLLLQIKYCQLRVFVEAPDNLNLS